MLTTNDCTTNVTEYGYKNVTVIQQNDDTYYIYLKYKNCINDKKPESLVELEWSNSMFKDFKNWQNKMLAEKKSLNVVLKKNRNHIKIRNSMKTKKTKPKKGGKC